jgi:GT2 family glycosyltransferase
MKPLPLIAAIPNYNMASVLDGLLNKLTKMNYDAIYVLDDASTDDSALVCEKYKQVTFVSSPINKGSSAARNLILGHINEPCIIHFLDADVDIEVDTADAIRQHKFKDTTGFVGGRMLTDSGEPYAWSFGPKFSLSSDIATIFYRIFLGKNEDRTNSKFLHLFKRRPLPQNGSKEVHPYWVIESNFFIRSETFKKFGGFDDSLREHDIQPLAYKLRRAGFVNDINENVVVTRNGTINVRPYNRLLENLKSEVYIIRKYIGIWRWIFGTY